MMPAAAATKRPAETESAWRSWESRLRLGRACDAGLLCASAAERSVRIHNNNHQQPNNFYTRRGAAACFLHGACVIATFMPCICCVFPCACVTSLVQAAAFHDPLLLPCFTLLCRTRHAVAAKTEQRLRSASRDP